MGRIVLVRSLAVVMSQRSLSRLSSYRGSRGGRTRQSSVRASRRSKTGSIGRIHSPAGVKSSPQLDRHPSVRYSIRRRRDGSKTSMDRDSAEASLLAEVIAAEVEAARLDSGVIRGRDDVEHELGRAANVLDMLHTATSRSCTMQSIYMKKVRLFVRASFAKGAWRAHLCKREKVIPRLVGLTTHSSRSRRLSPVSIVLSRQRAYTLVLQPVLGSNSLLL